MTFYFFAIERDRQKISLQKNFYLHVVLQTGSAIAAGPVSLVSTGPLFPSLVACLALPIIAPLLGGHPRNALKHIGTMLKLVKWLRTVRHNCSASLPSNNFPFLQANDS